MSVLVANNLRKTFGEKILIDDISFTIETGDRIGLIGVNGTGKSTLLQIISGQEGMERGSIDHANDFMAAMVDQEPVLDEQKTILEAVYEGDADVMRTLRAYERAVQHFEQEPENARTEQQWYEMQAKMDAAGAWEAETLAKTVLSKLGLNDFSRPIDLLSGGQKKRVALARALIQPADLLMLDEPTNHLDAASITWLEGFLSNYSGALLMVTHDRYFLNRVTNSIFELEKGQLYRYPGNYETYLMEKDKREEEAARAEDKRQNLLRRELAWLHRGARARGTKQKAHVDRVEALKEEQPEEAHGSLHFATDTKRLGKKVIEANNVSKSYGERNVISDLSERIVRGDRVGITGANGTGKSTFLHLLAGRTKPDTGTIEIGETVRIGYFTQGETEIDGNLRVLEYIRDGAEVITTKEGQTITAEQMLERFLFPRTAQWTYISRLSGGERRRLYLLRILMEEPNVLFLDEPTNNLDIATLRLLEDYLLYFPGAVVVVSHDRYFLDRVTNRLLIFEEQSKVTRYQGDFESYLKDKVAEQKKKSAPKVSVVEKQPRKKVSYREQEEWKTIEERIDKLEAKQAELGREMENMGSDAARLQELAGEQSEVMKELEEAMERWEALAVLMEEN